jgi:hypothetical protein
LHHAARFSNVSLNTAKVVFVSHKGINAMAQPNVWFRGNFSTAVNKRTADAVN